MKVVWKYKLIAKRVLSVMCIFIFYAATNSAQTATKMSYIYLDKLSKANEYYKQNEYNNALGLYLKIFEKYTRDTSVIIKIANSFWRLNDTKSAENWYRQALKTTGNKLTTPAKLGFAQVLAENKKYDEALQWYKEYNRTAPVTDARAKEAIKSIENLSNLLSDTIFYTVNPVNINTSNIEFGSCFYNDGIIYLSDRNAPKSGFLSWFFSSLKADGSFSEPVEFHIGEKTKYNEGTVTFYNSGKSAIFSRNFSSGAFNKNQVNVIPLQLFQASQGSGNEWQNIKVLPFVNKKYSFTQPSVTTDGKTLYFVSDTSGGYGGTDLYVCRLAGDIWSAPENLGPKINTAGNEMFPYIYKDTLLYFSSDGHGGLGGLDIFKIGLNENSELETIGSPVNSSGDDFGILPNKDGLSGYFASNRTSGAGGDDIYSFKLVKKTLYVKVIDDKTTLPLSQAEIYSGDTLNEKHMGTTDNDGNCSLIVPVCNSFQVRVKKTEYEPKKYTFENVNTSKEMLAVIPLKMEIKLAESVPNQESESVKNTIEAVSSINENISEITSQPENKSGEIKRTVQKSTPIPYKPVIKREEDKVIISDENNKPITNVKNVLYKVQIWASRAPANEAELRLKYKGALQISSFYDDRWYKYSIGEFSTYTEAKECLYSSMVYDAFIIAYMNKKRVQITIAKSATNETDVEKPVRYLMMKPETN
jgi:hypothetical protein